MAANFVETLEPSGRTVVEMNDHSAGVFWLSLIIAQAGVWMFASGLLQVLMAEVLAVALVGILYLATRTHVRIVIDPGRRVLVLGRRVIRLDQIARVELGTRVMAKESGPGGGSPVYYRVEIVLRSGERVPTTGGFGQFAEEDRNRLMDLINAAAGTR